MLDYATVPIAGIEVQSIPLPGVTPSQTGYAITAHGQRVIFCGEAIHSPGKLARVAPLQYNYNDLELINKLVSLYSCVVGRWLVVDFCFNLFYVEARDGIRI